MKIKIAMFVGLLGAFLLISVPACSQEAETAPGVEAVEDAVPAPEEAAPAPEPEKKDKAKKEDKAEKEAPAE